MGEIHKSSRARTHYLQKGKIRTRKRLPGILERIFDLTITKMRFFLIRRA